MILSTKAFNNTYSAATGITLGGTSPHFRQSGPIPSINHPGSAYHFEFWKNGESLYASLHVRHSMHPTIDDINLINNIDAIATPMIMSINHHLGLGVVNTPHLSGGIGHADTHTFNVLCNYNAATHADIMNRIIQFVQNYGL